MFRPNADEMGLISLLQMWEKVVVRVFFGYVDRMVLSGLESLSESYLTDMPKSRVLRSGRGF